MADSDVASGRYGGCGDRDANILFREATRRVSSDHVSQLGDRTLGGFIEVPEFDTAHHPARNTERRAHGNAVDDLAFHVARDLNDDENIRPSERADVKRGHSSVDIQMRCFPEDMYSRLDERVDILHLHRRPLVPPSRSPASTLAPF